MSHQHQKFLKRLAGSGPAIFAVARYLSGRGYDVCIPAIKYAPTAKDHLDYVDGGDIKIRKDGKDWERIEVKGRTFNFYDQSNWPFPDMVISNKASIDRADPFPRAYFIVSKDLKRAAIVRGDTRDQWYGGYLKPENTGNHEAMYFTKMDGIKFIDL